MRFSKAPLNHPNHCTFRHYLFILYIYFFAASYKVKPDLQFGERLFRFPPVPLLFLLFLLFPADVLMFSFKVIQFLLLLEPLCSNYGVFALCDCCWLTPRDKKKEEEEKTVGLEPVP